MTNVTFLWKIQKDRDPAGYTWSVVKIVADQIRALDSQLEDMNVLFSRWFEMIDNLLPTLSDADKKAALVELMDICTQQLAQAKKSLQEERHHIEALSAGFRANAHGDCADCHGGSDHESGR